MSYSQDILTCFDDLVLLQGCQEATSTSGLYSDNIDITKDFIEEIRTRKYASAQDFFTKKFSFALKTVFDKTKTFTQRKLKTGTLLDNFRVGQFQDNLNLVVGDGMLKGINFDLCNTDSYLDFFLAEISLQVNVTQDIEVLIYDLMQNKLLDTITIPCVADEIVTVYPQKIYKSDRRKLNLFIGYDTTGIDANTTYIKKGCSTCSGGSTRFINNGLEKITAVTIDPADQKIKGNLVRIGETGGLSIVHSLSCNHESWLCSFSKMIALPALFQYGVDVIDFALTVSPNDRINPTVTLNKESLDERRKMYQNRFDESFSTLINNIQTPTDSKCFVCREPVRHVISLP